MSNFISVVEVLPSDEIDHTEEETTKRNGWKKLDKMVLVDGSIATIYPFIAEDSMKDKLLLQQLVAHRPFWASQGTHMVEWERVAQNVNIAKGVDGKLVFCPPISARAAKLRCNNYVDFARTKLAAARNATGCDSEEAPNEIIHLLEELLELWDNGKTTQPPGMYTKKRSNSVKNKHKADAEAVRNANYAAYVARNEKNNENDGVAPKMRKTTPVEVMSSLSAALADRTAARAQSENRWERQMELQQQQIAMEKERNDRMFTVMEQLIKKFDSSK
jgi:hypothetical protein